MTDLRVHYEKRHRAQEGRGRQIMALTHRIGILISLILAPIGAAAERGWGWEDTADDILERYQDLDRNKHIENRLTSGRIFGDDEACDPELIVFTDWDGPGHFRSSIAFSFSGKNCYLAEVKITNMIEAHKAGKLLPESDYSAEDVADAIVPALVRKYGRPARDGRERGRSDWVGADEWEVAWVAGDDRGPIVARLGPRGHESVVVGRRKQFSLIYRSPQGDYLGDTEKGRQDLESDL